MRLCLLLAVLLAAPSSALAQADEIQLAEIVPALEGTELGAISIGPAPPPGASRLVRRSEVVSALRRAGRTADGLRIPRSRRIRRGARTLAPEELRDAASRAIAEALAPCNVEEITVRTPATVADGALSISADGNAPRRSGQAPVMIVLASGGRTTRVPAQARVSCPAPVIRPGAHVRLLARFGAVVASAPGVARQPGRVGDIIRVSSLQSRARLRARILDAERVEVLP